MGYNEYDVTKVGQNTYRVTPRNYCLEYVIGAIVILGLITWGISSCMNWVTQPLQQQARQDQATAIAFAQQCHVEKAATSAIANTHGDGLTPFRGTTNEVMIGQGGSLEWNNITVPRECHVSLKILYMWYYSPKGSNDNTPKKPRTLSVIVNGQEVTQITLGDNTEYTPDYIQTTASFTLKAGKIL